MIKKLKFTLFIIFFISSIFIIPTFADNSSIDMNINSNSVANNTTQSNSTINTTNTANSNILNNSYESPSYVSNSARVSTTTDEFGLTNILNIMLVVIGILLVLLSIAILIRLKN